MGLPMIVVKKEGRGRPVMITAGAHAMEPSGVSAALQILEGWHYSFPLYMMPLRDPLGCQSYETILGQTLNREVHFKEHDELSALLLRYADRVYINSSEFLLVSIGQLLFTNLRYRPEDAGPRQNERYINAFLEENPSLLEALAGRRVICPANMAPNSETVHCYERAFTAEISRTGIVADNNRRFGSDNENPEVSICRRLCDQARPGLVLDLHEGFSNTYYFFCSNYTGQPDTADYVDRMNAACLKEFPAGPWRLENLISYMPECRRAYREPAPGVLESKAGCDAKLPKVLGVGFTEYASRYCPSTTVEAGNDASLAQRVKVHMLCAEAALSKYEKVQCGENT